MNGNPVVQLMESHNIHVLFRCFENQNLGHYTFIRSDIFRCSLTKMYRWNPLRLQTSFHLLRSKNVTATISSAQTRFSSSGGQGGQKESSSDGGIIPYAVAGVIGGGIMLFEYNRRQTVKSQSQTKKSIAEEAADKTNEAATPPKTFPDVPKEVTVTTMNVDAVPNMPKHVTYLMVGAGTAAFAASRAIKARDPKAKIIMIGEEDRVPYMRPPLSKEMWFSDKVLAESKDELKFVQWNGKNRSLFFEPRPFYIPYQDLEARENGGISVITGRRVVKIDPVGQKATLDNGNEIGYDKCLVATGS